MSEGVKTCDPGSVSYLPTAIPAPIVNKVFPDLDISSYSHRIPIEIIQYNGPPFNSKAWQEYAIKGDFSPKPCTQVSPGE